MVLADLRQFCFGEHHQVLFDTDPLIMAANVGRNQVYRRILRFVDLTDDQIDRAGRAIFERDDLGT